MKKLLIAFSALLVIIVLAGLTYYLAVLRPLGATTSKSTTTATAPSGPTTATMANQERIKAINQGVSGQSQPSSNSVQPELPAPGHCTLTKEGDVTISNCG